jgi:uncharacterized protein DUF6812
MKQHSSIPPFSSVCQGNDAPAIPPGTSTLEEDDMTFEYDEKGKIFTDIISKISIPATIQTTTHLIRGQVHVRRDQRIKDELDLDENFLAMTDVSVLSPDGQTLFQAPFLAVRRSHIVWVLPEQNQSAEKESS